MKNLFSRQKALIALSKHKPVIMATGLMHNMVRRELPTRAEISDVGNAVCDGCHGVMLGTETAAGMYARECTQMVRDVCLDAERCARQYLGMKSAGYVEAGEDVNIEKVGDEYILYCTKFEDARKYTFMRGVHIYLKSDEE